jgi:hypothetical protein
MQEQGIKMNNLNASFVGSVNMEAKTLSVMAGFYRRFSLKCLADPKVNLSRYCFTNCFSTYNTRPIS